MSLLEGYPRKMSQILGSVIQSILGVIIVLIAIPVAAPLFIILWTWRCAAVSVVSLKYGQRAQPVSGMDCLFALDSQGGRAICSGVAILKGCLSLTTARNIISERILDIKNREGNWLHPKFRQVLETHCGVVVWMWAKNFNIDNHVKELRRDGQPCYLRDEDDLLNEVSTHANEPFVKGYARWEVLVAPLRKYGKYVSSGEEEWNHTAIIVRAHHALGDGRSIIGLFVWSLIDPPSAVPISLPLHPLPCKVRVAHKLRMLWSLAHLPWVILRIFTRGDKSALHGTELGGVKHIIWSPPLPLNDLRKGRLLAGVSVNDIILAGLSAAFMKFFSTEGLAVPSRLLVGLAVDVRTPGRLLSLSNRISLCPFWAQLGNISTKERLARVHMQMNRLKCSPAIMMNYFVLNLTANLLPSFIARKLLSTHGITMFFSNMPGPTEQLNFSGHLADDIMFWIPTKSMTGLGISVLSYRDSVRIGLNVDSMLIPNRKAAQDFVENIIKETENVMDTISAEAKV